ncbi:hypothetical protein V5O48_003773 [Marasmius crinis-equi]|uniref:Uncharacterized protein n=1 Tax=Marasmius crinis-equi TaxID=585013 RepID=A0ABR3FRZ7_9AGAR
MVNIVLANTSRRFTARLFERSSTTAQRVAGSATGASSSTREYSSSRHENDPHTLETEKQRNLNRAQHKTSTPHSDSAPGWNEGLSSDSEAAVKADRDGDGPSPEQTIKYTHNRHDPKDSKKD